MSIPNEMISGLKYTITASDKVVLSPVEDTKPCSTFETPTKD